MDPEVEEEVYMVVELAAYHHGLLGQVAVAASEHALEVAGILFVFQKS